MRYYVDVPDGEKLVKMYERLSDMSTELLHISLDLRLFGARETEKIQPPAGTED